MKDFIRLIAFVLAATGLWCSAAVAQPAFDRPIHLIVPFASGGATDAIGRVIGRRLSEVAGQPVVVENKPGAGGTIGIDFAARAAGDSNTIVLVNALQHTSAVKLYPNLKYDAIKSFKPLASIGTVRYLLLVNAGFEAKDYDSFIKLVRRQPGKYSFASAGVGSAPHLVMELFSRAEGLSMVHIPYNGSGPAMNDVAANHVPIAIDNVAAIPLIKAGRLRALATSGEKRAEGFPDVPTFSEVGLKTSDMVGVWGLHGARSHAGPHRKRVGRRHHAGHERSGRDGDADGTRHTARIRNRRQVRRHAEGRSRQVVEADRRSKDQALTMDYPTQIPFAEMLDFELLRFEDGEADIACNVRSAMYNSMGSAHGGVSMSLLDIAMVHAARSPKQGESTPYPVCSTIEMKTTFLRPGKGRLLAKGTVVHRTGAMIFCEASVFDEAGDLTARGSGTFKYISKSAEIK